MTSKGPRFLSHFIPSTFSEPTPSCGLWCTSATRKYLCQFHTSGLLSPQSNNLKPHRSISLQLKCPWWAHCHSVRVFRCFQWLTIFERPSAALYDEDTIVGCVSSHWKFTQCHSDHFWHFAMFLFNFQCFLAYIWLIATSMHYLCIPPGLISRTSTSIHLILLCSFIYLSF